MPSLLDLSNDCLLCIIDCFEPYFAPSYKETRKEVTTSAIIPLSQTCRRLASLTAYSRLYLHALYTESKVNVILPPENRPTVLVEAVRNKNYEVIELLMARRGITAARRPYYQPKTCAFAAAVMEKNREMFEFLLAKEKDPETALQKFLLDLDTHTSALGFAAETGSIDMFDYILSLSPPGILTRGDIESPVNAAVRSGNVDLVQRIFSLGISTTSRQNKFLTRRGFYSPFYYLQAEHSDSVAEMVELLVSAGYDIDEPDGEGLGSPLLYHSRSLGRLWNATANIIKTLVANGANPNISRVYGPGGFGNPFLFVARAKDYDLAQFLLDNGALPRHDDYTYLPCYAAYVGDIDFYRYLVHKLHLPLPPANPDRPYKNGTVPAGERERIEQRKGIAKLRSPLHLAAERNRVDMVRMLIADGNDVNARDGLGMTPLHTGTYRTVGILLSHGADHTARDDQHGRTPFHYGLHGFDPIKIKTLLEHDAAAFREEVSKSLLVIIRKINIYLSHHQSSSNPNWPVLVELLARHGADLNVADENGYTLMHACVRYGLGDIVRCLVKLGANPGLIDTTGCTPRAYAKSNVRMKELLDELGVME